MTSHTHGDSLLTFPCDFTIKVFGHKTDAFESAVLTIIHQHAPNLADRAIHMRPSKNGNYLSLSITVHVESKQQLDTIYQALSSSPHIIMAL